MIELKYFKNIHARVLNTRKNTFVLNDACVYSDKDNNRYCYITLSSKVKDELLSIMFHVRQYDSTGQFLKEGKFYIPNCYHPSGAFEIDEPFPVEKECDAVEIYVERALFSTKALYNDKVMSIKSVPEAFAPGAKPYIPASTGFTFPASSAPVTNRVTAETPVVQTAPVAPAVQPAVAEEKPAETIAESVPVKEEVVEGVPAEEVKQPEVVKNPNGEGSFKFLTRPFWIITAVVAIVVIILVILAVTNSFSILFEIKKSK